MFFQRQGLDPKKFFVLGSFRRALESLRKKGWIRRLQLNAEMLQAHTYVLKEA
jgi:hypothetical protein